MKIRSRFAVAGGTLLASAQFLIAASAATTMPTTAPSSMSFPTFGIALAGPAGWTRVPEGGLTNIGRWTKLDATGKPTALLMIEMESDGDRTLKSYAVKLAIDGLGEADDAGMKIDGEETAKLTEMRRQGAYSESLITAHNKQFYVISGFADADANVPREAMKALAASIHFSQIESPTAHLEMRGERFPMFNAFTLEPLAAMRPNPTPSEKGTMSVGVFDFTTGKPAMIMTVQAIPLQKDVAMAQLQTGFPGKLAAPGVALTWSKLDTPLETTMSSLFTGDTGQGPVPMSIAIVRLDASRRVLVNFTFPGVHGDATAAYEAASKRIVESIRPLGTH